MQQIQIAILFFHWFFKFRKPFKRIIRLTTELKIQNSLSNPNNRLLNQQNSNINQEESNSNKKEKYFFFQNLFHFTPREVGETEETKIETKQVKQQIIETKINS